LFGALIDGVSLAKILAVHGGIAIHLFVHDMFRLSVEIDLTYLLIAAAKGVNIVKRSPT
jgi:hypothetical protein